MQQREKRWSSLIKQNQIRLPDFVRWYPEHGNASIVRWVPFDLVIRPVLLGFVQRDRIKVFIC